MNALRFLRPTLIPLCLSLTALPGTSGHSSTNLELARQLNQAFVEVAEKVTPTVVVILVTQKPATPSSFDTDSGNSQEPSPRQYRRFFRRRPPQDAQGEGSGIIIRDDGYILTNGHVVEDASSIEVRLQDGRSFKGTVRGVDPKSDLAVIKIDAKHLRVATLANSDATRVGEFAIAIGAPFNLDYSVTYGHVSAKGRSNVILGEEGESMDQDFIQTDANINPGNSGGPLVNINGEVIGVNTLIHGLHTGIGFAIPSSLAKIISQELIANGKFTRAWLGIEIHAVRDDPEFRDVSNGVDDGVIVNSIRPDGPASKSDLRPSDVITTVDGRKVSTPQQLRGEIRTKKVGQSVTLDVVRNGKPVQINVKPAEWTEPAPVVEEVKRTATSGSDLPALGMTVHGLSRQLADQFGVDMTEGVIVVTVENDTPAAKKGLKPGDVITEINHQPVQNGRQFREALRKADLKKGIIVNFVSGGTSKFEILKEGDK